jgi:hypothetical protein
VAPWGGVNGFRGGCRRVCGRWGRGAEGRGWGGGVRLGRGRGRRRGAAGAAARGGGRGRSAAAGGGVRLGRRPRGGPLGAAGRGRGRRRAGAISHVMSTSTARRAASAACRLGPGPDDARGALPRRRRVRRAARWRAWGGPHGRTTRKCWTSAPCLSGGTPPIQGPVCALHVLSRVRWAGAMVTCNRASDGRVRWSRAIARPMGGCDRADSVLWERADQAAGDLDGRRRRGSWWRHRCHSGAIRGPDGRRDGDDLRHHLARAGSRDRLIGPTVARHDGGRERGVRRRCDARRHQQQHERDEQPGWATARDRCRSFRPVVRGSPRSGGDATGGDPVPRERSVPRPGRFGPPCSRWRRRGSARVAAATTAPRGASRYPRRSPGRQDTAAQRPDRTGRPPMPRPERPHQPARKRLSSVPQGVGPP